MTEDAIDVAVREWATALPDLDVGPGEILARIQRLSRIIDDLQNRRLRRRPGMVVENVGDFDVLRALRRAGPACELTPTQLRQAMLVSGAGLTGRLKRLEKEGWITRQASPQDGRSTVVRLTPDGRADLDRDLGDHFAFERALVSALSAGEAVSLAESLRVLLLALDQPSR